MRDINTERLKMRAYRGDDLDLMAPMYADPDGTAFTKLGRQTREQTKATLEDYLLAWRERAFGMRALFLKPDPTFVGECGVFLLSNGDAALRYAIPRQYWGRGFAAEAVGATIDDIFSATSLDRVLSVVQTRNPASGRVMEKAGWRAARSGRDGDVDLTIYELTRAEWRSRNEASSVIDLREAGER